MMTRPHNRTARSWRCAVQAPLALSAWFMLGVAGMGDETPEPLFSRPVTASSNQSASEQAPALPPSAKVTEPNPECAAGDLQAQKDLKFRELRRQLEILSQLAPEPSATGTPAVPEKKERPDLPSQAVPPAEFPRSSPAEQIGPASPKPNIPESTPATAPHSPAQVDQLVVEGTIDRFALATSLFGTGQVDTCLDVLKYTDLKQLSREDQIWAEYMTACCLRRLGQIDAAKQSYRRILGEKDAEHIGPLARWWLDDLDAKAQLKADIQRLSETLAAWEAEIDTLAKQSARTTTAQ